MLFHSRLRLARHFHFPLTHRLVADETKSTAWAWVRSFCGRATTANTDSNYLKGKPLWAWGQIEQFVKLPFPSGVRIMFPSNVTVLQGRAEYVVHTEFVPAFKALYRLPSPPWVGQVWGSIAPCPWFLDFFGPLPSSLSFRRLFFSYRGKSPYHQFEFTHPTRRP